MNTCTKFSTILLLGIVAQTSFSGEISVNAGISVEAVAQTIKNKTNNSNIDSNNLVLRPFVSIGYDSRDLDLLATATHNQIRRSLDDADATNNFTDFTYVANYQIIDNLLRFDARGAQTYRSRAANSFLVDDFLLNAENLSKNNTNSVSINLNLPSGRYFGLNATAGASRTSSKAPRIQQTGVIEQRDFNSDAYNAALQIENGRDIFPFTYDFNGNIRQIDRELQQNFKTQLANLRLGANVSSSMNLRLIGYYENNEISSSQGSVQSAQALREFYSYGVGVAWQPAQNRFIELAFNRSVTKNALGQENEENDFVSVDTRWNFSARTNISGNYSRRFFGSSGSFNFNHNLRNWRSSISYNETVTTNSQLLLSQEEGLFICTNGSSDVENCRLSDGLDTSNLAPNQALVPFTVNGFELNDRVILRKTASAQTAWDLRRTTIVLAITDSSNEEVEITRQIDSASARISASLTLSPRSKIISSVLYSNIERTLDGELQKSTIRQFNIEYERRLSRRLFASLGYRYLDRAGDTLGGIGAGGGIQGINGPLTDNRISAQIRYEYDNAR